MISFHRSTGSNICRSNVFAKGTRINRKMKTSFRLFYLFLAEITTAENKWLLSGAQSKWPSSRKLRVFSRNDVKPVSFIISSSSVPDLLWLLR